MKYEPHNYQIYATRYIEEHPISAVLLDMGLGKTSITLTALNDLLFDSFEAHRILVIAPLRVARDTWPAEADKWDHLQNLICSVAVGTEAERRAALIKPADIYIINRENVQWLIEESKLSFNFDTVVVDELSSFKNYQAKRFRALMKVRPKVKRIIGLTGTPSANGLMDLWAEFRLLDMGARLGRFISHYRLDYFQPDKRNGQVIFSYKPLPGAEQCIYDKISDITISMKSTDLLKMPELVSSEYTVRLSDEERKRYDELKQDLVLQLPNGDITAANAAALTGKLAKSIKAKPRGRNPVGLFLCPESEVNPCHINQSVPAPTPAAVGSLSVSNTAPSIKRSWTNNTTSTSATPSPTNATAEAGNASATATSSCIPFARSARSKAI